MEEAKKRRRADRRSVQAHGQTTLYKTRPGVSFHRSSCVTLAPLLHFTTHLARFNSQETNTLTTMMTNNAASTPLITEKWEFAPSVGVKEYTQKLKEAERIVDERLESLEQYKGIPGQDFLHDLDELFAFIAMHDADGTIWRYYHPHDDMRKAGESASAAMERLDLRVSSSPLLAEHLAKVDARELDNKSQRFLTFCQRDAKRAGAFLGPDERDKFIAISNTLQDTQRRFMQRIVEDKT